MNQRFFCFVCPASSWWCDAQLCSLWICTGGVRPQSDRRGQYSLHPPCTCPGPAGAASTSVRHQHPAEELCHLSGCRNRWEIFFFLTSWNLWKMDELGQEKWKRVSNQMLFFFFFDGSVCDLHHEVLPESETSFSVTFHRPDSDSLAVCEH